GTTHGSANYSSDYYGQIVREGMAAANPMLFAEGVPNAAAAHLSLMLGLKGSCQTIIGSRTAALDALRLAAARIAVGEWERAAVRRVLRDLGNPRFVVSSANVTWIDRVEAAALRHVAMEAPASKSRALISSIYGYVAETFSTCPLAALAAVLLTGRLPALFGP